MKEILWFGDDLSKMRLLGLDYIGTYIGPDYTVLEISDEQYDYLSSLGRNNPLYVLEAEIAMIAPKCRVHIDTCEIQGWDFTIGEDFTKSTPVISPFDEQEYVDDVYYESLDDYFENNLGCEPNDIDDKAQMLFILAKYNHMLVSELLWKIERSKQLNEQNTYDIL